MGSSGYKAQAKAQVQASQLQSQTALQVAQLQSDAALQAALINERTSKHAAGMAAGGAMGAASIVAGASDYAADLQFAAAERALAEQQRQYDLTTEMLSPYVETGEKFLGEVEKASTLEGFADRLATISDTDLYRDLVSDRQDAAAGALAQAGLSRSGAAAQSAADITTQLAMAIEGQDYSRKMNQVNLGQAAAARQANINMGYAGAVSNIETGTARSVGQQTMQGAIAQGGFITSGANAAAGHYARGGQAAAQGIMNAAYYSGQGMMGSANAIASGMIGSANMMAQGRAANRSAWMGAAQGAASIFFSDERLKTNMEPVGKIGPLHLYEWDWIDVVKGMTGTEMTTGFKAQEVESHYPEFVANVGDYKVINYPALREKLLEDIKEAA